MGGGREGVKYPLKICLKIKYLHFFSNGLGNINVGSNKHFNAQKLGEGKRTEGEGGEEKGREMGDGKGGGGGRRRGGRGRLRLEGR